MTTTQIRDDIHQLVNQIDDRKLLEQFYHILYQASFQQEGYLWDKLTLEQQSIVLKSYEESKKSMNLMTAEKAKSTHQRWHIK